MSTTDAQPSTLADWLLEQIAADEETAREAGTDPSWRPYWQAEHIAHWNPARVLAECAAKRRLIGNAQACLYFAGMPEEALPGRAGDWRIVGNTTLRYLAQPYADRPGFRPEWRV